MATIDAVSGPSGAKIPSPAKPTWLRSNGAFCDAKDFVRTGLVLTVIALLLGATYCRWLGYV